MDADTKAIAEKMALEMLPKRSDMLRKNVEWFQFILDLAERLGDGDISQQDILWMVSQLWDDFNPAWAKLVEEIYTKAIALAEFVQASDMNEITNLLQAVGMLADLIELIEQLMDAINPND